MMLKNLYPNFLKTIQGNLQPMIQTSFNNNKKVYGHTDKRAAEETTVI